MVIFIEALITFLGVTQEIKPPDLASIIQTEVGNCSEQAMIALAWTYQHNPKMKEEKRPGRRAKTIAKIFRNHPDPGYKYVFSDNDLKLKSVQGLVKGLEGDRFECKRGGVTFFRR